VKNASTAQRFLGGVALASFRALESFQITCPMRRKGYERDILNAFSHADAEPQDAGLARACGPQVLRVVKHAPGYYI
jgi:hypothetical protein